MKKSLPHIVSLDQVWSHIKHFFPEHTTGRPRKHSNQSILEAIFYACKSGCQWDMLPDNYPPYKTVYHYFRKWSKNGLWELINKKIRALVRIKSGKNRYSKGVSIDSQSVKTFYGSGAVGFDGHKKVKGRKRHLMTDSLGLLIFVICLRANLHDLKGGKMLINRLRQESELDRVRYVYADKAYTSLDIKGHKANMQISSSPIPSIFIPLPQRWKVERSISWTRGYRRLNMDYEKKTRYSEAWVYIAFIQIMGKKLEKLEKVFR